MGLTVLDAGVVIGVLDDTDRHHTGAITSLNEARERGDELALPASAYAECLVSPSRRGTDAVAIVDEFLDSLPVDIAPATRAIAATAASLRALHGPALRLPDALVVATAMDLKADRIITTDRRWPPLPIAVEVVPTRA